MARNNRTPGAGTPRALENVFVGTSDNSRDTASAHYLQARRIGERFKFSAELAAEVAGLAFPVAETWRGRL